MEKYKNIVILGGGFGGIQAALSLSKKLKGIKDNNYRIVELEYFVSILPFSKALKMWFRGFLIFIKNDKLG